MFAITCNGRALAAGAALEGLAGTASGLINNEKATERATKEGFGSPK